MELTLSEAPWPWQKRGGGSLTHEELTLRAIRWLSNKASFNGIRYATEIKLADGYVADAVALGGLQGRFHQRYCHESGIKEVMTNRNINGVNIPLRYLPIEWKTIFVFEAKATRADFLSTFGNSKGKHANRHSPIGGLHWIVMPKGMVKLEEVPTFWGLLEAYGRGLTEKVSPYYFDIDYRFRAEIAEEILWHGLKYDRLAQIPTCPDCLKDYPNQ